MNRIRIAENPIMARLGLSSWLLLCALLPIDGRLVPVPLALAVVLILLPSLFNKQRVEWAILWPLLAFYALHLLGLLWSTDLPFGLFDLQIKLGLVLLPLAAGAIAQRWPGALRQSMVAFTIGTTVAFAFSMFKGWMCYTASSDPGCFSQSAFSYSLHPSYAAWYACWVVAYWGVELLQGRVKGGPFRFGVGLAIVVAVVFIALLASKSGAIGLILVGLFLGIMMVRRLSGRKRNIVLIAGLVGLVAALSGRSSQVGARMAVAWQAVEHAMAHDPAVYTAEGGSEMRLVAWECSVEILSQHPFGVGTGDIKHALVDCYESKRALPAAQRRLNSHSQFLQGGVALGWAGLVLTLLIGLVPLWWAWGRRSVLLGLFALLFLLNAAVESVLEVQAGVVIVAVFMGLLAIDRSSHADLSERTDEKP